MKREKLYAVWIGLLLLSIPLALNLVPPNGAIGFRTAKTLSTPQVWQRENTFSGWVFIAASLIGLGITYYKPDVARKYGTLRLLGLIISAFIVSLIYLNFLPC